MAKSRQTSAPQSVAQSAEQTHMEQEHGASVESRDPIWSIAASMGNQAICDLLTSEEDGCDSMSSEECRQIHLSIPWLSQFLSYDQEGNLLEDPGGKSRLFEPGDTKCFEAAKSMVEFGGAEIGERRDSIQIFYGGDERGTSSNLSQLSRSEKVRLAEISERSLEGVEYINFQLEIGKPVMVGVSYRESENNTDKEGPHRDESMADHFVTIVGRENERRYIFHDPGSRHIEKSENQHFVLDGDDILVRDPDEVEEGGKAYEVSHVRKNIESPNKE